MIKSFETDIRGLHHYAQGWSEPWKIKPYENKLINDKDNKLAAFYGPRRIVRVQSMKWNMNENQSHFVLWYRNEVVVLFLLFVCTKIEQGVSGSEMQIDLSVWL